MELELQRKLCAKYRILSGIVIYLADFNWAKKCVIPRIIILCVPLGDEKIIIFISNVPCLRRLKSSELYLAQNLHEHMATTLLLLTYLYE